MTVPVRSSQQWRKGHISQTRAAAREGSSVTSAITFRERAVETIPLFKLRHGMQRMRFRHPGINDIVDIIELRRAHKDKLAAWNCCFMTEKARQFN